MNRQAGARIPPDQLAKNGDAPRVMLRAVLLKNIDRPLEATIEKQVELKCSLWGCRAYPQQRLDQEKLSSGRDQERPTERPTEA